MPAVDSLTGYRVVADPAALDQIPWEGDVVMRIAADEALTLSNKPPSVSDPYAIVEAETGFVGVWMSRSRLETWFESKAEWALPTDRTYFCQGMAAGLPVKVWVEGDRALLATSASLRHDLEARL